MDKNFKWIKNLKKIPFVCRACSDQYIDVCITSNILHEKKVMLFVWLLWYRQTESILECTYSQRPFKWYESYYWLIYVYSYMTSVGNIIKNVCFKCLNECFYFKKTLPNKKQLKKCFFKCFFFFLYFSFFKISCPSLLIIFKNTIFSFIKIIHMYHQQQNKWYQWRFLLAHFEAIATIF